MKAQMSNEEMLTRIYSYVCISAQEQYNHAFTLRLKKWYILFQLMGVLVLCDFWAWEKFAVGKICISQIFTECVFLAIHFNTAIWLMQFLVITAIFGQKQLKNAVMKELTLKMHQLNRSNKIKFLKIAGMKLA